MKHTPLILGSLVYETGETLQDGIPLGKGELILVVDDNAAARDITRQILESYGYRVATASDGMEAVALYLQNKTEIRATITDMMMPHMDGAATIRAIRHIEPRARIIAMSGLAEGRLSAETSGLDVQAFLAKPYAADTLRKTLNDVLYP
jgi:hypothetical protein